MGDTETRRRGPLLDDWAKLHVTWYTDSVLRAAAQIEPACLVMWPLLVAMSKAQSHAETNPTGLISISLADLADAARVDVEAAHRALETLVEGEFISFAAGPLQTLRISVVNFSKWQTPRKSKSQRNERHYEGARAGVFHSIPDAGKTLVSRVSARSQAIEETETETETRQETNTSTSAKPKRDYQAEARQVFDHWVKTWDKRSNTVFKGNRMRATIARLRDDGYTVSQLCEAISGYRHSEHHNGSKDGRVWDDLELFMRSASKVDAGIAHGVAAANRAAASVNGRTPLKHTPRHIISEEYDDGIQWHTNDAGGDDAAA